MKLKQFFIKNSDSKYHRNNLQTNEFLMNNYIKFDFCNNLNS